MDSNQTAVTGRSKKRRDKKHFKFAAQFRKDSLLDTVFKQDTEPFASNQNNCTEEKLLKSGNVSVEGNTSSSLGQVEPDIVVCGQPLIADVCQNITQYQRSETPCHADSSPCLKEPICRNLLTSHVDAVASPLSQDRVSWDENTETSSLNENIVKFFNSFQSQNNTSALASRIEAVKNHPLVTSKVIENSLSARIPLHLAVGSLCQSPTPDCASTSAYVCESDSSPQLLVNTTCSVNLSSPMENTKSREEVEAERKARKAAKQAAKGKGKVLPNGKDVPEVTSGKSGTHDVKIPSKPKEERVKDKQISKQAKAAPKSCAEKLTDSFQKLHLSQNVNLVTTSKVADEPDFVSLRQPVIVGHPNIGGCELSYLQDVPKQKSERLPSSNSALVSQPPAQTSLKEVSSKSKAELRAERRAKQEAQRVAKASQLDQSKLKQKQLTQPSTKLPTTKESVPKPFKENKVPKAKVERAVKLFSHLYQNSFKSISHIVGVNHPQYHPAIVRLGVQYAKRTILGSNARCIALLYALKEVVTDYITPPEKEFSRGLEGYLHPNIEFLHQCRPQSVSMINAMRYIKWQLTQLSNSVSDSEAKHKLHEAIEQYIFEQIDKAAEAIGKAVKDKISDNDVIMVYACSSLVLSALKVAFDEGRQFRVVVVDSLPWLEGREMLRRLVSMGVKCSYVHISAASFVMREVSKVLLGAHALLANGYVMSRAGSSQLALLAHTFNKPVLVCCETHKFSERVQTDSFVFNELGDPDELIGAHWPGEREAERKRPLAKWRNLPHLNLLNLVYDVTPPDLVTAVVTERAILPCTSVPVILRIKPIEC